MAVSNNTINTRIQLKSDTEANWNKVGSTFIPLLGEMIIYTADSTHPFCRVKIGDGATGVSALPFIDAGTLNGEANFIVKYDNFNSFPQPGSPDKLYVDLATDKIYYYIDAIGYKSLSNFTLDVKQTTIKDIVYWGPGKAATATVNNNILVLENGIAPQLLTQGISVVTGVQITGN